MAGQEWPGAVTGGGAAAGELFQGDDDSLVFIVIFDFDQGTANVGIVGDLDDFFEVDAFLLQDVGRLPWDELGGNSKHGTGDGDGCAGVCLADFVDADFEVGHGLTFGSCCWKR